MCDVGVFSAPKTAYREQVDLLYQGGANAVRLEHFGSLYDRARTAAMTSRNITAGWSKCDGQRDVDGIMVLKSPVKRIAHAAEKAFADHVILHTENGRLLIQNNEKRSRRSRPARKVGMAKVMSYEDIINNLSSLTFRVFGQ
ncbi:hypothetical protein VN97_g11286 [Penicillium thymicola]|uniref:Uncharacterized protein n=1 Tax=Penicillium thymicola TaxID=293382 RepID=A0AAI9T7D5_PENTH|nr:hypothetical protein VN97_g11286 [Penicillium thymicola]